MSQAVVPLGYDTKPDTDIDLCSYMSQTVVPLGYDTMPDTDVDLRLFIHESDSSTTWL